jgi:hypothetical protein
MKEKNQPAIEYQAGTTYLLCYYFKNLCQPILLIPGIFAV